MFPQYEQHSSDRISGAWAAGLFVFDTNVLLNLYRYQATTRDELINVLGRLANRVWIPHHVALEFQRNRLKVIAEQNRRFSEVRKTVEKAKFGLFGELDKLQLHKRHSLIDPRPLLSGFDALVTEFLTQLDTLRKNQQGLTDTDLLKVKVENLFEGRVGEAPPAQAFVDEIYGEADWRFRAAIPPGYQDSEKDKDEPDEHFHGGILYKRKYGDYLIWRQITAHTRKHNISKLILVTDDGKEDWWYKVNSDGLKTIGPRTELIEDARTTGSVDTFLMYSPENFLKYAREFLKAPVSEATLKEVRDVSIRGFGPAQRYRELREFGITAEHAVHRWLSSRFESVQHQDAGFPDFIVLQDGKRFGFEVRTVRDPRVTIHVLRELLYRGFYETERNGLAELTIILVAKDTHRSNEAKRIVTKFFKEEIPERIRILLGAVSDGGELSPLEEVRIIDSGQ